jgi:hypothetical protein
MAKMNWARQNSHDRMQRYGSEDVRGADIPFSAPLGWKGSPRRAPVTKADLRAAAAAVPKALAVRKSVTMTCPGCAHTATIIVVDRPGLRFKCSRCGAAASRGGTP